MEEGQHNGAESYLVIDQFLREKSEELLIITPYIDLFYAKVLIRQSRNKRIRLITSGAAINKKAISALSSRSVRTAIESGFYFTLILIGLLYLRLYPEAMVAFFVDFLIAAYIIVNFKSRWKNIAMKVTSGKFVHEKIYISDTGMITGSANLTFRGTHKNVEFVDYTRDQTKIQKMRKHFHELWKSS
jgi:phosphatidylserine/phosphatidylglycerophosphate/cardiolipin synthase-like enzyme